MVMLVRLLIIAATMIAVFNSVAAQGHQTSVWNPLDHVKLDLSLEELVAATKASAVESMTAHKDREFSMIPTGYALKEMNAKLAAAVAEGNHPYQERRKLATPTSFTCESFSKFSPWSMCSDIVDYPFLVETSSSRAAMETAVRAMLPTSALGFINNYCLSDLKKKVCAQVYQPCVTGVVSGDSSTNDATTGLPMKLPCKSVCAAASYTGSTCQGLLEGMGVMAGGVCNDSSQFDPNSATCNAISGSLFGTVTVAPHKEPYIGSACAGIVTETYLGDTAKIAEMPGLSPLLPPYVQQGLIEMTTAPIFAATPRFLYDSCSVEQRKFFCALKYMPPQTLTALNSMFGPVYMPKFPSQASCQTYRKTCSPFITDLGKTLDFNCATEVSPGTPLFPVANVILAAVPNGSGGYIYLQTDVNDQTAAVGYSLGVQCPYGFSSGEQKGKETSDYVYMLRTNTYETTAEPISPCKLQCPALAVDTFDDFKAQQDRQAVCDFVALFILVLLVTNMLYQEKEKRNSVVFTFAIFMLTGTLLSCISFLSTWWSSRDTLLKCDGPLVFEKGQGAYGKLLYIPVALFRSWSVYLVIYVNACVSLEVWLRVFWQIKNIDKIKLGYSIALAVIAFVMWIVPFLHYQSKDGMPARDQWSPVFYNFPHGYPNMFFIEESAATFTGLYVVPIIVYYGLATLITGHMLYYCISISLVALSKTGGDNPLFKLWKTYRALISFNVVFQVYSIGILLLCICYEYVVSDYSNAGLGQDLSVYYKCLISNFTSLEADPTGGTARCGVVHPNDRTPWVNTQLFYFLIPIPLALVAKITYNDAAGKFYWQYTPAVVQNFLNEYYFAQKVHVIGGIEMTKQPAVVVKTKEEAKSEIV